MNNKLLIALLIIINLTLQIQGSYRVLVEDTSINYNTENFYSSNELVTPIPITITPLSDTKDSLFITFSYGGLQFKDESQYFDLLSTQTNNTIEISSLYFRQLYSKDKTINYQLRNTPDALTQLQPFQRIVDQSSVLSIYNFNRLEALDEIKKTVVITIDNTIIHPAGYYTDIFNLNLYTGSITKSNSNLVSSRQIEVELNIPNMSRIISTTLKPIPTINNMYIFTIKFISTCNTKLSIAKDMDIFEVISISDGINQLKENETDFIYTFPFSARAHTKEFLITMKPKKETNTKKDKKGFYFKYKLDELY
jgi:hypothetical protein